MSDKQLDKSAPAQEPSQPVSASADQAAPATSGGEELTASEFCMRLSRTDKRVEMIGAFHHSEKSSGKVKDTESAFQARYAAFLVKPAN